MQTDSTTDALTLFDQGVETEDRDCACPEVANPAREIYLSFVLCFFFQIQTCAFKETESHAKKIKSQIKKSPLQPV